MLVLAMACERGGGRSAPSVGAAVHLPASVSSAAVPASARKTVLILGTSLTAGLGLDPDAAYPALLQRKIDSAGLHFDVVNDGLSGETSGGALRRVDWLLRGPVDVFVLETGANDALRGLNVDSTKANLIAIVRAVRVARPDARICLVAMEALPNMGPQYTAAFRAIYPAVARATGADLFPFLLAGVAGHAELNQADGIHPNVQGETIVAATMWKALAPVLRGVAGEAHAVADTIDGQSRHG
jgi:acyl-CoA thioesterase-1